LHHLTQSHSPSLVISSSSSCLLCLRRRQSNHSFFSISLGVSQICIYWIPCPHPAARDVWKFDIASCT
jgi:hypothetical protein